MSLSCVTMCLMLMCVIFLAGEGSGEQVDRRRPRGPPRRRVRRFRRRGPPRKTDEEV